MVEDTDLKNVLEMSRQETESGSLDHGLFKKRLDYHRENPRGWGGDIVRKLKVNRLTIFCLNID